MSTNTQTITNSFCWAELNTGDLARAKAFYGGLYGWGFEDVETPGGPYAVLDARNGHGGGMMPTMPDQSPAWMPYVEVRRLEDTIGKVEEAHGTVVLPPSPLSEGDRIAWIRDPSGVPVGLYDAGAKERQPTITDPGGTPYFGFYECIVRELGAAKAFYGHVFQWSFETTECNGREYVMIDSGSGPKGGFLQSSGVWVPEGWLPYVRVHDLEEALRAAIGEGAKEVVGVTAMDGGSYAVYSDADGACLGLYQAAG